MTRNWIVLDSEMYRTCRSARCRPFQGLLRGPPAGTCPSNDPVAARLWATVRYPTSRLACTGRIADTPAICGTVSSRKRPRCGRPAGWALSAGRQGREAPTKEGSLDARLRRPPRLFPGEHEVPPSPAQIGRAHV